MKKVTSLFFGILFSSGICVSQSVTCILPDSVINDLKITLQKIYEDDQFITGGNGHLSFDRNGTQKSFINIDSLSQRNFTVVSDILKKYGWPHQLCIGSKASMAIYLVLHHANLPITERKKYFSIMRKAVKKGKINKVYLAYFEDRTLVEEGKKQKYGTQLKSVYQNGVSSKPDLQPVEDPKKINKRRKRMGLNTIEEYLKESYDIIYEPKN